MAYTVETPAFSGPIDVLLHLVGRHEVDVLDVPLAPVVESFVALLTERPADLTTDVVSEFLLVAAVLVELKSQRLLPGRDAVDEDEELVGWEERDLLLARLLEMRAYSAVADVLVAMAEQAARSVPREVGLEEGLRVHAPDLLAGVSTEEMARAYLRAVAERPVPQVDLSHVTVDTVTVSETVQALSRLLPRRGTTSFRELVRDVATRMEVIVHFLAVLELCKLGRVTIGQGHTFGDLQVTWIESARGRPGALVGATAGRRSGDEFPFDEYDG